MRTNSITFREIVAIGLMLFALFFGAGNMIFPPLLGQEAGTNVWPALIGFLLTGVGLPLMGVIAIAKSGDLKTLAHRVHPIFAIIFPVILYLAIGPFFGIPRTGTVAYEMSITPFLSKEMAESPAALILYSVVFFGVTLWLSLNPTKLVDRIGKMLTPALLLIIAIFVMKSFITPLGTPTSPIEAYSHTPFFKGFIEGYLTLDALAALVFGIVVIDAVREKGITRKKEITRACISAGTIAALGLAAVYLSLGYLGSTSITLLGPTDNGANILSEAAVYLFGNSGIFILGIAITLACLTTSIGLVSSCAVFFSKFHPALTYKKLVMIISIFSTFVANVGLTVLISISLPVLMIIYPIAIVLIILSLFHTFLQDSTLVYRFALIPTGLISLIEGLKVAGIEIEILSGILSRLPFYNQGISWLIPALLFALIGYFIEVKNKN
jgi:branched-chain amino acid:cation transporter, LIVCS family